MSNVIDEATRAKIREAMKAVVNPLVGCDDVVWLKDAISVCEALVAEAVEAEQVRTARIIDDLVVKHQAEVERLRKRLAELQPFGQMVEGLLRLIDRIEAVSDDPQVRAITVERFALAEA